MGKTYLEFRSEPSNTFWEIEVTGNIVTVRYGQTRQ
jgi:predicted DNA-binding WGR domain protein